MTKSSKRPQTPKPNRHERVLDLRRGSRTSPVPSGKVYSRKPKNSRQGWSE